MHDPHITFNQANFTVGDMLDANCTSSPATPVPELTWLLNGKKVGIFTLYIIMLHVKLHNYTVPAYEYSNRISITWETMDV